VKKNDLYTVNGVVTVTAPAAVVYNDANGQPVTTSFAGSLSPSGVQARSPVAAPTSSGDSDSDSGSCSPSIDGYGIAYTPKDPKTGDCKHQDDVDKDFETFSKDKYKVVRLYGSDCDQTSMVMQAAKKHDMKVMAAVFSLKALTKELDLIISAGKKDWSLIHTVIIGNEQLSSFAVDSISTVTDAVSTARSKLKKANYHGCVVTAEVFNTFTNPKYHSLCNGSDYIAANAHGYFDPTNSASNDGKWLKDTVSDVEGACRGKKVIITESGWPTDGDPVKPESKATASESNQQKALQAIKDKFGDDGGVVFFEYMDDETKADDNDKYHIETHFGMYGKGSDDPFGR
jgi:exo-beta-1,3-glucanase (GH17 family)